jgi:hypothetical protein
MSLTTPDTIDALHKCSKSQLSNLTSPYNLQAQTYRTAQHPREEPVIPSESLFNFDTLSIDQRETATAVLPSIASCATHLQLLQVLFVLRQNIFTSTDIDASCGIEPERVTKTGVNGDTKTFKDESLWAKRQAKWTMFVEHAAVRFLVWRRCLAESPPGSMVKKTGDGSLELKTLPPLDVLMVWHSFMLNPRLLARHCRDERLYHLRMPWSAVHDSIRSHDWTFIHGEGDSAAFSATTGLPANLYKQFSEWHTSIAPSGPTLDTLTLSDAKPLDATAKTTLKPGSSTDTVIRYTQAFASINGTLAIQLRDAVIRQTSFVDKMNRHLWIRSPAIVGTLTRAQTRYRNFLTLLRLHPGHTIVPTLDIDLVWHTHQCAPAEYAASTEAVVGRFINHDDTIAKISLSVSYDATRTFYRVRFGDEYLMCGCWDCEALLSGVDEALRAGSDGGLDMATVAKKALDSVLYYRAVEVAVRKRQPLPVRD